MLVSGETCPEVTPVCTSIVMTSAPLSLTGAQVEVEIVFFFGEKQESSKQVCSHKSLTFTTADTLVV